MMSVVPVPELRVQHSKRSGSLFFRTSRVKLFLTVSCALNHTTFSKPWL